MPLDKSLQRLTNFVFTGQQYCFKHLFDGISVVPADFWLLMSSIFKPLIRQIKIITYLDDVFIQDTTIDKMLQILDKYHTIRETENLKAALDKSSFFLESVKLLGHQIENNRIHPLKSKISKTSEIQDL